MPNGTGWVNWDQIFAANQPAAQQMAGQVAGGIQQTGDAAKAGVAGLSKDFDAAAAAGTTASGYTGPKALSEMGNYGTVQKQAGQAQQGAALTSTSGGISALIGEQYGPRSNSAFDGALAGAAGGGRFSELRQNYGGLLGALGGAETAALERAKVGQANSDTLAAAAQDAAKAAANAPKPVRHAEPKDPTVYYGEGQDREAPEQLNEHLRRNREARAGMPSKGVGATAGNRAAGIRSAWGDLYGMFGGLADQ